jgi:hypothetical protein
MYSTAGNFDMEWIIQPEQNRLKFREKMYCWGYGWFSAGVWRRECSFVEFFN